MNDLTKPVAMISYANTVGLVGTTVYFSKKITSLETKLNDAAEEIETIRDGVKEKVPFMENNLRGIENNMRGIANVVNSNLPVFAKKIEKTEKKIEKIRLVLENMGDAIESLEYKFTMLMKILNEKDVLGGAKIEIPTEAPQPPVQRERSIKKSKKTKKSKSYSSSEESESESSEEEVKSKSKSKSKSKNEKSKSKKKSEDSDEDDTSLVARLASKK